MKTAIRVFLVTVAIFWAAAASEKSQAVLPPPDGGYPGFNTAEGQNALFSLTAGAANTAVGWYSLSTNAEGSFNTATGAGALLFNIADQNTAFGAAALLFNTTADHNTAVGAAALLNNTIGVDNTAIGASALSSNNTGPYNTAIGNRALFSNISGDNNTAVGWSALFSNTTGVVNTAIGESALFNNITGSNNTAIGDFAGFNLTGSGNICIGAGVSGVAGENSITRIRNIGSTPVVGGINVVVTATGGLGDQVLGYASSSRRYKEAIEPMGESSETLFALKPVAFRAKAKTDAADVKYYGLIAEDVATVDPDLVVYNPGGKPETLRFDSINAMLLNEFLKEHRRVQDLYAADTQRKKEIAEQREQIRTLTAQLNEQVAEIQKLSAAIQASKPAPQMALNP